MKAENNSWDSENYLEIAETIIDGNDNPSYGIVDFDPIYNGVTSDPDPEMSDMNIIGNIPNPFAHSTAISFTLASQGRVSVEIFNLLGQKIKRLTDAKYDQGTHSIEWNGKNELDQDVPSGMYFYNLKVNDQVTDTRKCVLIR